jgi:hypothetical protein
MSYDVSVDYPAIASVGFNYTYNCSPMFYYVLEGGINGLAGLTAKDAQERLTVGIAKMEADPEKYRAMNPENGWGDYEGALEFLRGIKRACADHPDGTVSVC